MVLGDAAAFESHRTDGMGRDQFKALGDDHPGSRRLDQESAKAVAPAGWMGAAENHVEMGQAGVGDQALAAVEHVGPAPLACPQPGGSRVRSGIRLGQGERPHVVARGQSRQIPALLGRCSRQRQRIGGKRLHREQGVRQGGDARQDLTDDAQVPGLHTAAHAAEPRGAAYRNTPRRASLRNTATAPRRRSPRGCVQLGLHPRGQRLPQTKLRRRQPARHAAPPKVPVPGSRHRAPNIEDVPTPD